MAYEDDINIGNHLRYIGFIHLLIASWEFVVSHFPGDNLCLGYLNIGEFITLLYYSCAL